MSYTADQLIEITANYKQVADKSLVIEAKKKEKKKLDPRAKVRNRGTVCVPAESAKDKKDHFPINDEGQARSALSRVEGLTSAPWYNGSLEGLRALVKRKVHAKFPSIGKDKKKKSSIEISDALFNKYAQDYDDHDPFDPGFDEEQEETFRDYEDDGGPEFADPGGRSALRAGERTEACPQCHDENVLTPEDVRLGYRCDRCADEAEGLRWPRGGKIDALLNKYAAGPPPMPKTPSWIQPPPKKEWLQPTKEDFEQREMMKAQEPEHHKEKTHTAAGKCIFCGDKLSNRQIHKGYDKCDNCMDRLERGEDMYEANDS